MGSISTTIFYIITFLSIYVQVFFLITFLDKRRKITYSPEGMTLTRYPKVTVAVPCYNEAERLEKTVLSLLALDYPKEKLEIFLVDDGSTDNTWEIIQRFATYPNVHVFKKENGGKYTALNVALEHATGEFFGCLDSDSLVDPAALIRIIKYFEDDAQTMAVAPSVIVNNPKNIIQKAQHIEYHMAVYNKKMLAFVGGINVTPGPFSIFRKYVFDTLGPYKKAHNTEDQEIALRMQKHGYKIDHCPDAYVYTNSPTTVKKLYRQRLRWVNGFIRNCADYRTLIFKKKYGAIGLFTLPAGVVSIIGIIFLFANMIYSLVRASIDKITKIHAVGFERASQMHFDWFYINTKAIFFFIIILYVLIIVSTVIGRHMTERRTKFSFSLVYFFAVYSVVAPFWILRAVFQSITQKETNWAVERKA